MTNHSMVVDIRTEVTQAELENNLFGIQMYNRWLADFCSVAPERHLGLAHVPIWDMDWP